MSSSENPYGQDNVPSPRANRLPRRHTVANPLASSGLFAPSYPQRTRESETALLRRWVEEREANGQTLPDVGEPVGNMEDVALDEDNDDDGWDNDWDLVATPQPREDEAAYRPMSTAMTRISGFWSRDEHQPRPLPRPRLLHRGSFVFDDDEMVSLDGEAEEEEEEDEDLDHREPSWDFDIPFGPRVQNDYTFGQLYPRTATAIEFAETLPGMRRLHMARETVAAWTPVVQNNIVRTYNEVAPRAVYTAQRTGEALVVSGRMGVYLAGEAWTAGQGAAQMMRQGWRTVQPALRMVRDGRGTRLLEGEVMRMVLQDAAMAGLSAIPPYDLILRSNGGRRRF